MARAGCWRLTALLWGYDMRAGDLRNRITIQRRGEAEGRLGNPKKDSWVDLAKVWASIRHPSGLASIQADAQTSTVKASIRIRYRTDVTAGMQVVHGPAVYKINAVLPDLARREYIDLVCETL